MSTQLLTLFKVTYSNGIGNHAGTKTITVAAANIEAAVGLVRSNYNHPHICFVQDTNTAALVEENITYVTMPDYR